MHNTLYKILTNVKEIYSEKKHIGGCLRTEEKVQDVKTYKGTFVSDEYVNYLNGSDDFISVYICQNLSIAYFKYVWFIYINYALINC